MKDSFVQARLVEPDLIRLMIFSSSSFDQIPISLLIDQKQLISLKCTKRQAMPQITVAEYRLEKPLELGHSYLVHIEHFGTAPLDVSQATGFPGFEEKFYYDGDDLGATYSKQSTSFALWAPLASSVTLLYRYPGREDIFPMVMKRTKKGVFRTTLFGNMAGVRYAYAINNNEVTQIATDPYAKASTQNGEESVVVDFSSFNIDFHDEALPRLQSPTQAIIYEGHVRDLTISKSTDIVHKGRFKGLYEKGRKTKGGHPAGFDYLISLGFTHLQLLPIYDYKTVDEKDPDRLYNWGYDPAQYFVPEGSYASDLEDPLSRIRDLMELVSNYHQERIGIVMDVVFNHVYEARDSVFEKIVPNYYFRRRQKEKLTNCSGCGNDLATERKMVRKMILDCCKWWIDTYHIDGFRFDLMGLIDAETLLEIEEYAKKKKPAFLLYGEGWNMAGDQIDGIPLGHQGNYDKLPGYGFFNDCFREATKRYASGNTETQQTFKFAYCSSSLDFILPHRYLNAKQSINYVECHDDSVYFDLLTSWYPKMSLEEKLDRCLLAEAMVLFSYGIPFIHAGQEIGQSKWGIHNSYNKGDHYNKFSYSLLDERYQMVEKIKKMIALRKKLGCLYVYDPRTIDLSIDIQDVGPMVHVVYLDHNLIAPYEELEVFFNPSDEDISYHESSDRGVLFALRGEVDSGESRTLLIPRRSALISYKGESK